MELYRNCSKFDECSCNNCPLSDGYPDMSVLPEDGVCTAKKAERVKIAAGSGLRFEGMTTREWSLSRAREALKTA